MRDMYTQHPVAVITKLSRALRNPDSLGIVEYANAATGPPIWHTGCADPEGPEVGPTPRLRRRTLARGSRGRRARHRGWLAVPRALSPGAPGMDRSRLGHERARSSRAILSVDATGTSTTRDR